MVHLKFKKISKCFAFFILTVFFVLGAHATGKCEVKNCRSGDSVKDAQGKTPQINNEGGVGVSLIFPEGEKEKSYFQYKLNPGENKKGSFEVRNKSNKEIKVNIYKTDAFNTSSGALTGPFEDNQVKGLGSWLRLEEGFFVFKPKEKRTFNFELNVPKDAKSGDNFGFIFICIPPESSQIQAANHQGMNIGTALRVGITIWQRTPGKLELKFGYSDIKKEKGNANKFLVFDIQNEGNQFVTGAIVWELKNASGKTVSTSRTAYGYLLPGSKRTAVIPVDEKLPSENYTLETALMDRDLLIAKKTYSVTLP